jgi:hypothetical protein
MESISAPVVEAVAELLANRVKAEAAQMTAGAQSVPDLRWGGGGHSKRHGGTTGPEESTSST